MYLRYCIRIPWHEDSRSELVCRFLVVVGYLHVRAVSLSESLKDELENFKRFSDTEVAGGLNPSEKIGSCSLLVTVIFFFFSQVAIPLVTFHPLCEQNYA